MQNLQLLFFMFNFVQFVTQFLYDSGSLNQNIGGLKLYKHKVVAISDHLLKANPKYLEQLEADIDKSLGVKVYRVSQVKKVLIP